MIYSFEDYQFNSVELILYRGNVIIPIRNNEAKVLTLLLNEATNIVSKSKILNVVWSGKVVSEQAVFQNISSLRSIFGEHAIKTFSGKGYQWQLSLDDAQSAPTSLANQVNQSSTMKGKPATYILLFSLLLLFALSFFYIDPSLDIPPNHEQHVEIKVVPLLIDPSISDAVDTSQSVSIQLKELLASSEYIELSLLKTDVSFEQYINTPSKYFQRLLESEQPTLVLAIAVSEAKPNYFLRYQLHGPNGSWDGEFQSLTMEDALQQLVSHLDRVSNTSLLITRNHRDANHSELTMLNQRFPKDAIILERLIGSYLQMGNLNKALLLAEELKDNAGSNRFYQARSELAIGNILAEQGLSDSAEVQLITAQKAAEQLTHFQLQSDIAKALSLVARNRLHYADIRKYLRRSMYLARVAKDPVRELSALNYLYIFSYKLDHKIDAALLLEEAELIIKGSDLPEEHYAQIYLHKAISADDVNDKEVFVRRVLALFKPNRKSWLIDSAQILLVELLIEQQRWQELNRLFTEASSLTITESYLVAKLYFAQQRWLEAATYGSKSFKDASMVGDRFASLNAALLLLSIHAETGNKQELARYSQFIVGESTEAWRQHNHQKLSQLPSRLF
ncbi:winged helix-turn-helix domain-containing protein [Shewanella sp. KX20019]|uniref:winged helix-turn-helix domain-containing protein n=1 Tax=Shewanella sp. KX20019 TaxID=2803864 RepID=UPI0019278865|nr:winged helix-turn-helix domain-containing protein [Shewanella sp. KX20019]QQX80645.1 winged helix-turn-helix domain-containing protein [Shewanella sp. KX20019]